MTLLRRLHIGAALLAPVIALLAAACAHAGTDRVLLVVNQSSAASREVGAFYASKRGLAPKCVCRITAPDSDKIGSSDYHKLIRLPISTHITKNKLSGVDFIVTTKGVPLVDDRGCSVDSMLTVLQSGMDTQLANPYFGREERFSRSKFRMFLVTRLDGYTVADAKALVTRSLQSKGKRGRFLLDVDPYHDTRPGYQDINQDIRMGALGLLGRGIPYTLDTTRTFMGNQTGLMGYYSWGSNDTRYDAAAYKSNRFVPGAIAETVVSTSARTLAAPNKGQSLIADLIRSGVTGVKGYVTEPYGTSMAKAAILFDRYTKGYNLAESFYMASPFICWKDVVIGDPLCAPYAK